MAYAKNQNSSSTTTEALISWLATARTSLDGIFLDPWFTSLWTLQEAFLCQHAYILPLEADLILIGSISSLETGSHATVETLCTASTTLSQVIERERPIVQGQWQADKINPYLNKCLKYLNEVYGMLSGRGLLALATRNPIALYKIAQYRTSRLDQDRVYGIQQIFDLRLGASAPGVSESRMKDFNRFVLEDELGAAVLIKYHVASQIHVFNEPVEEGRGWRFSASSTVPSLEIQSRVWDLEFENRCRLSTEKIKGQRWGLFHGQICGFADLLRAWRTVHETSPISESLGVKSPQEILLDTFLLGIGDESLVNHPDEPVWTAVWSKRKTIPRDEQQHRLAWGLNELVREQFQGESPVVLLLGSFLDGRQSEQALKENARYHVGLILVQIDSGANRYWKRLGFCIWQYGYSDRAPENNGSPDLALVHAENHGVGWRTLSGIFG